MLLLFGFVCNIIVIIIIEIIIKIIVMNNEFNYELGLCIPITHVIIIDPCPKFTIFMFLLCCQLVNFSPLLNRTQNIIIIIIFIRV